MKFYGVSVGPGDYELITLKAVRILESVNVIAVPRTHKGNTMALDIIKKVINIDRKKIIYLDFIMSKNSDENNIVHNKNADIIINELENNDVAMISIGDISVFSTFSYILNVIKMKGLETEIIAGVPSFCAAAAAIQESLTDMKKPLHIIPGAFSDIESALGYEGTKVIMKSGKRLNNVLESIKDNDYCVVQNCGLENEIVLKKGDSTELSDTYFTIILIKED